MRYYLKRMINYFYYIIPFISYIAESNPPIIIGRLDLLIIPFIEPFLAIIIYGNYNMSNYFTKIHISPGKYFTCLIYFALYTRIIPFLSNALHFPTPKSNLAKKDRIIYYKEFINKQNKKGISYES